MRPELVIFDCDGVLVDSENVSNAAMVENLARYGLMLTVEQSMQAFIGKPMPEVEVRAREMGADLPADWIDKVYADMFAQLRCGVSVVPGIPELLASLDDAGIPCCVASNGSRDKMQITLGQSALWERFESVMFSAHDMGTAKPDPTMFLTAAARFDVAPDRCVVIEDSATGAEAARRAAMRCIGYAPLGHAGPLRDQGAEIVHDMLQIAALIGLG